MASVRKSVLVDIVADNRGNSPDDSVFIPRTMTKPEISP